MRGAEQPCAAVGDQQEQYMGGGQICERTDEGPQVADKLRIPGSLGESEKQDEEDEDVAGQGQSFFLLHRDRFQELT